MQGPTYPSTDGKPQYNEDSMRAKYGTFKGYYRWELAKAWLTMTNDQFHQLYGFNWVPSVHLKDAVRPYLG